MNSTEQVLLDYFRQNVNKYRKAVETGKFGEYEDGCLYAYEESNQFVRLTYLSEIKDHKHKKVIKIFGVKIEISY